MNVDEVKNLSADILNDLLNEKTQLGFAFILSTTTSQSKIQPINVLIEAEVKGTWDSTKLGEDYTYSYPDNSSIIVTIKNAGKYKINYFK